MPAQWTFPHSTCEKSALAGPFVQPFSVGFNFLNAALLTRSALTATSPESRNAIASFALFEIVHTMSHAVHLNHHIHEIMVHTSLYIMAYGAFNSLKKQTSYELPRRKKMWIAASVAIDLIAFSTIRNVYSVATGLFLIAVTISQFHSQLNVAKRHQLKRLVGGAAFLLALSVVETTSCDYFRSIDFDYHPWVIEPWGLILFQWFAAFMRC